MAENYISTVTLPGNDEPYNISAASAGIALSAVKLASANNISAIGDVEWKVSFDGSSAVSGTATIKRVPTSAISAVAWSAVSGLTGTISTTAESGFAAPSAVKQAIDNAISNVYKFKGTCAVADLPPLEENVAGDVWNLSTSGIINEDTDYEDTVQEGDNVAFVVDDVETGDGHWDKLASTLDTSNLVTKSELSAGTLSANFSKLSATTISGTISNYSSISSHVFNGPVTSWSALSENERGLNPISVNATFSAISSLQEELINEFAGDLSALSASALSAVVSEHNLELKYVPTPIIISQT